MKIEITDGVETPVTKFFSTTPETDAAWDKYISHPYTYGAGDLRILAQRLERERDEARADAHNYKEGYHIYSLQADSAERERDEAQERECAAIESWWEMSDTPETDAFRDSQFTDRVDEMEKLYDLAEKLERKRDEAREQNAKLREIADAFAVALERLDALYRSEQDSEAPMPRPDWLRRPLQMLDAELERLKEGAK